MRKILLTTVVLLLISTSQSHAIYREDGEAMPTPKDGEVMLMSATEDVTTSTPTKMTREATIPVRKTLTADTTTTARDAMKEKMLTAREEFKTKLATIKDAKKQEITTSLDARIKEMNTKRTTEMLERLSWFSSVLSKISSSEATLTAEGKNTTTLKSDITAATAAIEAATTAIEEQQAKEYTMNITTDAALKRAAGTTIKEFAADMKAVRTKVLAAQTAVKKAHKSLKTLQTENVTTTPSSTVTETP